MKQILTWMFGAALMLLTAQVSAQSGKTVQGMLRDTESRVVAGASVLLISSQDSLGTSASPAGIFNFSGVKAETFTIKVRSLGFEPYEKTFTFSEGQQAMRIPSFEIKGIENLLEEVVVNGVITVQVKGDTVEYSAKDLKLRDGSVAEDALKKLQGVEVDKDGNVTAHGESVTRVRINGKDFFGGDVKTATQNLPANIIDKIQVVDDYGDMANVTGNKTGDSEKVLNIQIDPKYNKGYMTTLRAGYGTEDRYQLTGMWMGMTDKTQISVLGNMNNMNARLFDFNTMGGGSRRRGGGGGRRGGGGMFGGDQGLTNTGSIGVNFRHDFSDKLKVYGSYSYGRDDNTTLSSTMTENFGLAQNESAEEESNTIQASHRFEGNFEWNISDKDYLKLTPQFGFDDNTGVTALDRVITGENGFKNTKNQLTNTDSNAPRYSISGLYNRKLSDNGRNIFFNFNYDNAVTKSEFDRELDNIVSDQTDPNAPLDSLYELTLQRVNNKSWNAGASVNYTEPLSEFGRLEFNYDLNVNDYDNKNRQKGYDRLGEIINDPLLNYDYNYDYSFTTHRIGASYRFSDDKLTYAIGAAVQPSILSGNAFSTDESALIDRKTFNFVPIARFEYKFSRQKSISVNYSGQSTEPNVTQILPFQVSTNRTSTTIGNPDLNPSFEHSLRMRYRAGDFQKGNVFFAMLNANLTSDKIVIFNKMYADPILGSYQELRYQNADENTYGVNGFYHFGKSIKDKIYSINLMGGLTFNKNLSYVSNDQEALVGDKNIANNWVFMQGLMFRYNPSENLEINPGVRYSYNYTKNTFSGNANRSIQSWSPNLIASVNVTPTTILGVDVSKTFNSGYGNLNANPFIINSYIEQRFLKGQRGTLRLQGFDLLNQQTNINRTISDYYITDSQTNRLARYFMLTFTFKLQKFSGVAPSDGNNFPGGMRRPRM